MKASKGQTPSADTCTSCYDDNGCCPSLVNFFNADVPACSSGSSSLLRCEPSGTNQCEISTWRLWTAILVPVCFVILLCVAGCLYCCFKKQNIVTTVVTTTPMPQGEFTVPVNTPGADAPGAQQGSVAPPKGRRGMYIQLK